MNILFFLVANLSSAFLTILGAFAIIGISMMVQSMVKTLKAKNYPPAFNAVVGLGILVMFLGTCGTLILLIGSGGLQAPIGFIVGGFIVYKKTNWCISKINIFTTKIEQITGN